VSSTVRITRKRFALVVVALALVVVALSFILPYVGGGHGIAPLP
jgi:hypothetical protein